MGAPEEVPPEPVDVHVGRKAVELGLITEMQFQDVLARVAPSAPEDSPSTLSAALIRLGLLTERQLNSITEDTASVRKKFGKYRISRQLGRGGMGVVFEAIDADLGRTVALKMLLSGLQTDPKEEALDEERFIREARVSANLPKHPNIVGIYESGILEGRRYIAMEYIEGCHFSEWCAKSSGPLRVQIGVLRDAALAVDHANRHGIIHRDLKPANILVDGKGRPHVTDFGLAKQIRQDASLTLTGGGKVMGTPTYISPEQAAGRKDVDRRTDVWALGIILYELLAGRPPFRGETPIDVMMKVVQNPVPTPSTVARGGARRTIDPAIEKICMKALAKEPAQRYATAKLFADDLGRWIKGETVVIQIQKPKPRRSHLMWAAMGIPVVAAGLVFFLIPASPSPEKTAAERRDRAVGLVAQGQRHLSAGKNADALIAFGEASELDPENRVASSGKREAERRLGAARATPPAAERPPGAPSAPAAPTAQGLVRTATEFCRANPKDIEGQIRVWEEAQKAAAGTPFAAEALRELQAAISRRRQGVSNELAELDRAVEALREAESFGAGRDILAQAARRHDDPEWTGAVQSRQDDLRKILYALYEPLKEQALDAKRQGDRRAVETQQTRVTKWKWPEVAADLSEALDKVAPAAPVAAPPPAPAPGSDPARPAGIAELSPIQGHQGGIWAVSFSPDGKLFVSSSFDHTVRLWDLPARTPRAKLVEGIDAPSVGFSGDGKWIVAGLADGSIRIWDTAKLQERTLTGHRTQVIGIAFSPDSRILASASTDGSVRLWDPATGVQKTQLDGHPKGAMCVAWTPDGKLLAVGCADSLIKLWELPSAREHRVLSTGIEGPVISISFSPNGKLLASGGKDTQVCLWEVDSGRRRVFAGHSKEIRGVACSPDGLWIASASIDGTLRLWQAASGETRATFTDPAGWYGVAFSKKGDVLAGSAGTLNVRLWDLSQLRSPKTDSK